VGDKWTLLIVRDLAAGPRRFVELQRVLPGISTEQLRSRLNRMVADGMLTRKRYREVPPRVDYELTDRARELMPILAELARWGYTWSWGAPRPAEAIDIGAIFRLAPGLLASCGGASGTAEFIVSDADHVGGGIYTISVLEGEAAVAERAADQPDVRVAGATAAWVAAFAPGYDRSGLTVTGDRELAEFVLDGLLATPLSRPASTAAA
jgi:DNA-binding HxlR family transcriptional regulator